MPDSTEIESGFSSKVIWGLGWISLPLGNQDNLKRASWSIISIPE